MIFIERGPVPAFLIVPNNIWFIETKKAINHYKFRNQTKSFKYLRYKNPEIKDALRAIFGTKCAYCESDYAKVSDGDVEHYRPKGRVEGKIPDTPGYYWLANDWDNLLLSCQHCNQARKNKTTDDDGQVLNNDDHARGKLDKFPLTKPRKRVTSPRQKLEKEDPFRLLLNPCIDKPEEHFEYDAKHALIKGKTDKGKESIEVYVLQRQYLVQFRKEKLVLLLTNIKLAQRALEQYNATKDEFAKEMFDGHLDLILRQTHKDSEYSGMCRFFVRKFLDANGLNP